jgi:NitT/TauT family transport system ATP-binding protein
MRESLNGPVLVENLSLSYRMTSGRSLSVLNGISFELPRASFTSIIGASGCGKTTLLQCLAGLLRPTEGVVTLGGYQPEETRAAHKIAFVFQKPVFFDWLNILDNVTLPARLAWLDSHLDRARYFLRVFGLESYLSAYPHELSGGMLSRAALARALTSNPQYLFLDEPFGNLDEITREELYDSLQSTLSGADITVVSVTHGISEAVLLSDIILVFTGGIHRQIRALDIPYPRPRMRSLRSSREFYELTDLVRTGLRGESS